MAQKVRVGIVGGAGYTAGELLRVLLFHPNVEIKWVHSNSNANNALYKVHRDLIGDTQMCFTDKLENNIDIVFLCLGHGDSQVFLSKNTFDPAIKIIDLSQDFRLKNQAKQYVYGLPELNKDKIRSANFVANPGCFATAIQLALLPLAKNQALDCAIYITALTGSTGAGQKPGATTHFSYRSNNISVYKAFEHQHLNEIGESLQQLQPNFKKDFKFIPQRGDFARGIFASILVKNDLTIEELVVQYQEYFKQDPFTIISEQDIDLKQVVNTNKCLISLTKSGNDVLITSCIDNLLKGASGQAVQNMNLMFGLPENAGLNLKASAF